MRVIGESTLHSLDEPILHESRVDAKSPARTSSARESTARITDGPEETVSMRPEVEAGKFLRRILSLLAVAVALAGCAGHQALPKDTITSELAAMSRKAAGNIADARRAGQLQQAIDAFRDELIRFHDASADASTELRRLNADPDATRGEFEMLLGRYEDKHQRLRDRILQRHFELIALTNPEEWKALAPHERKALLAAGG